MYNNKWLTQLITLPFAIKCEISLNSRNNFWTEEVTSYTHSNINNIFNNYIFVINTWFSQLRKKNLDAVKQTGLQWMLNVESPKSIAVPSFGWCKLLKKGGTEFMLAKLCIFLGMTLDIVTQNSFEGVSNLFEDQNERNNTLPHLGRWRKNHRRYQTIFTKSNMSRFGKYRNNNPFQRKVHGNKDNATQSTRNFWIKNKWKAKTGIDLGRAIRYTKKMLIQEENQRKAAYLKILFNYYKKKRKRKEIVG